MTHEIDISDGDEAEGKGERLALFGAGLKKTAADLCAQRKTIEQGWVEDLYQYRGRYPEGTKFPEGGSQVFVNITKPKTKAGAAQLIDMLFPADDKNYGVNPTPNPELADASDDETPVHQTEQEEMRFADGDKELVSKGDQARMTMEKAEEAAKNMERTIEDQLVECEYNTQARRCIYDAAVFGTGIVCGPEVEVREARSYAQGDDGYSLNVAQNKTPVAYHVPIWDFFPDLSASRIQECNHIFRRSYLTKKSLKKMRKIKGIQLDGLKRLLDEVSPTETQNFSEHVSTLRELSGIIGMTEDKRYEVWRYHGPIESSVLIAAGVIEEDAEDIESEYDGHVIFCGDIVLKAAINPMETEDWPYSVYCWDYDDNCIFGTGIPRDIKTPQAILNTSMRMLLDNSSKAAGPQIVKHRKIQKIGGGNTIEPWGLWELSDDNLKVSDAFGVFEFPSFQVEMTNIFNMARALIDEQSGLPMIQEGEQGQVTPTLGGMSMLMNSANTVRRSQVKQWDDYVTCPMIQRFYDWNMQFNDDPTIKGDLKVYARGTSALLVKEQQAQTLITMLDKYGGHPVLSQFFKTQGLDAFRKAMQAMHINPDDLLKTKEQFEADIAEAQKQAEEQGSQEDPRIIAERMRGEARIKELEMEAQLREAENQLEYQIAQMKMQTEMLKISTHEKITIETLAQRMKEAGMKLDLDMSKFKTEVQIKQANGEVANYGLD